MPRVVPGPPPGKEVEFIPKSFDNDKDPVPVRMVFKAPSNADRRALYGSAEFAASQQPTRTPEQVMAWREKLVGLFLVRIDEYRDPAHQPIVSARDLVERGDLELFAEAYGYASSLLTLTGDAAKPYAGPSESSPQGIRLSSGTAASADEQDSIESATADQSERTRASDTPASAQA